MNTKYTLNDEDFLEISEIYKLLGSETRLKIVWKLSEKEMNVSEICDEMKMGASAISHQLKELKYHKIVRSRKEAQTVYYSLDDHHIINILLAGIEHIKGDECSE